MQTRLILRLNRPQLMHAYEARHRNTTSAIEHERAYEVLARVDTS